MSSSRRPGGEINILAMLEGRSSRKRAKRLPAWPTAVWYGGAGVLACVLAGALAWMAHDVNKLGRQATAAVTVPTSPQPPAAADALAGDASAIAEQSTAHAAPLAPDDAAASTVPASIVPAAAEYAVAAQPSRPAAPSPGTTPLPARHPATAGAAAKYAPPRPAASYRPAPPSRPAAQPRSRRVAAPSTPAVTTPDLDVALISAIIQHAGRPDEAGQPGGTANTGARGDAQGRGGANCAGKTCGPRMPDQP